jgi:hypothetical protein
MFKSISNALGLTDSDKTDALARKGRSSTRDAMRELKRVNLPDEEKLKIILQHPELAGLLEAEQLGDTALGDIRTDAQLDANMMEALSGLKERSQTGLTEQDKFAMEEMLNQVGAQEQSQRKAIEQDMARQGMGDSGAALAAKLQGSQGGANQARQRAMQMAGMGQDQRMAALQNLGAASSQMQQAQFGQQAQVGSARDQIAQFNAQNRQGVNAQNLATQQNLANQRANVANQQSMYNAGLEQQRFQNEMQKATGVAGAHQNLAGMYGQQATANAQADAATTGALFTGVGTVLGGPIGGAIGKSMAAEDGGIAYNSNMDKILKMLNPPRFKDGGITETELSRLSNFLDTTPNYDPYKHNNSSGKKDRLDFLNDMNTERVKTGVVDKEAVRQKYLDPLDVLLGNDQPDSTLDNKLRNEDTYREKAMSFRKPVDKMSRMSGRLADVDMVPQDDNDYNRLISDLQKIEQIPDYYNADPSIERENPYNINEYDRDVLPRFKDGGIPKGTMYAEDGTLMYNSDEDIVGGDSFERDRVDAKLNSGEMVLNVAQQQRLLDLIRGEISPEEVGDEDIVEGVPSDYQQDIISGENTSNMQDIIARLGINVDKIK